jgi:hypothetical protein
MAQRVENLSACGVCVNGEINVFFANYSEKRLREDYIHCPICKPSDRATAGPNTDEEQITMAQYHEYLKAGWSEFNPV